MNVGGIIARAVGGAARGYGQAKVQGTQDVLAAKNKAGDQRLALTKSGNDAVAKESMRESDFLNKLELDRRNAENLKKKNIEALSAKMAMTDKAKVGSTREIKSGGNIVTQEYAGGGQYNDIATAPRGGKGDKTINVPVKVGVDQVTKEPIYEKMPAILNSDGTYSLVNERQPPGTPPNSGGPGVTPDRLAASLEGKTKAEQSAAISRIREMNPKMADAVAQMIGISGTDLLPHVTQEKGPPTFMGAEAAGGGIVPPPANAMASGDPRKQIGSVAGIVNQAVRR